MKNDTNDKKDTKNKKDKKDKKDKKARKLQKKKAKKAKKKLKKLVKKIAKDDEFTRTFVDKLQDEEYLPPNIEKALMKYLNAANELDLDVSKC